MTIALFAYRSFDLSKENYSFEEKGWKQISRVALAVLLSPFLFLADLVLIGVRWLCLPKQNQPTDLLFFKAAIQNALLVLGRGEENLCKELLQHDGEPAQGDPPFGIYQWGARALLAHHFLTDFDGYPAQYRIPIKDKEAMEAHVREVAQLKRDYLVLSYRERIQCLKTLWTPEIRTVLPLKKFLNRVHATASQMGSDPRYNELYKSFNREG